VPGQGIYPADFTLGPSDGAGRRATAFQIEVFRRPKRLWLHVLLFALTLATTTAVGAGLAYNFQHNLPAFSGDDLFVIGEIISRPSRLLDGLPFSLVLMAILLAHEMGHYLACLYYRVDATLPFFIPAPTLIGTLGAFIRIRSPIYTRRALFDIGIAGPLAGFALVIPAFAVGLAWSKVIPGIAERGELIFGVPAIEALLRAVVFPGIPAEDVYLHPVARAAWVGVLATALNLLPIGQLDGGHILYSVAGRYHRLLSRLFVLALIPMGLLYSNSWLLWALILFFLGLRHPSIYDPNPLSPGRRKLAFLALIIFLLSFSVTPVRLADGL